MGLIRADGSIQSGNTPDATLLAKNRASRDDSLYRCMVTRVLYTDDPKNITGGSPDAQVTYECIIIGGPKEGQILTNVRMANFLGGKSNYAEKTLRAASAPFVGVGSKKISQQDGDLVYVAFVGSNISAPVILGLGKHPLDTMTGAKSSQGPRQISEYNGIYEEINNNGEWKLTRKGGSLDPAKNVWNPTSGGNQATINLKNQQIIQSANNGAVTQTIDGGTQTVTIVFQSGMKVTIDGKNDVAQITTKGGASLKLANGKVGLGSASAELLDQLSQALGKLITFMNSVDSSHTHLGNLGYPTAPPTQASQFTQLGSDLQSIQSLINGIKGGI